MAGKKSSSRKRKPRSWMATKLFSGSVAITSIPEGSFRKILDEGEAALERRRTAAAKNLTPKAPRKRDVEADAKLKNRINKVLAKARTKWQDPKKRPEIDVMAKELFRLHKKDLGYKFEAIRKILRGTYGPSVRLKIDGL